MSITPKPKSAIVEDSIPAFRQQYRHISGQAATAWPGDFSGSGAPSGDLLSAAQGSTYARIDGTADTSLYLKGPSGWVAVEAAGDASTVESLTVDGGSAAAITVEAGFSSALDLSAMATGEGDILLGDNLASALQVREGANPYLTLITTNSAERVALNKTLRLVNDDDTNKIGDLDLAQLPDTGSAVSLNAALIPRTVTVEIAAGAVATLNATAVEVIPAAPAGFFNRVVGWHAWLDYGGVAYDAVAAGDDLVLRYTDASGAICSSTIAGSGFGDATADAHRTGVGAGDATPVAAAAVMAHILVGEWFGAAGNSPLKIKADYVIEPLEFATA